jgi:2-methylisocitrate lyase-like PEP mutase family enzyme
MRDQAEKCQSFHRLHEAGCFLIPNPWDRGSARLLEELGFAALATTSSGIAWSLGMTDNHVPLEATLTRIAEIASAVDIPVNADFEGGFAIDADGVYENVTRCVATGVAGLSIEDSTGDKSNPLFDFALSVDRMAAARRAIDDGGVPVVLTGRSEGFIVGRPDLDETVRRLVAYAEAGADCLYAPGLRSAADIAAVVAAVAPKPVNVLVYGDFTTLADLRRLGVRRISVGGSLARAAWRGAIDAAREMLDQGTFVGLTRGVSSAELEGRFSRS